MRFTANEKNVVDALSMLLNQQQVHVTRQTLRERLYLHPNFPSLVAISDVLKQFKVSNIAVQIEREQLIHIPLPSLAFLSIDGGIFAPIRSVNDSTIEWLDTKRGWINEPLTDFYSKWNQVVLLSEPNEQSGENNYSQKRLEEVREMIRIPALIVGFILSITLLFLVLNTHSQLLISWQYLTMLLIKSVGAVTSFALLMHSIDSNNSVARKLCGLGQSSNCNSILSSSGATLWGWLGWSEVGFIYFMGGICAFIAQLVFLQSTVYQWVQLLSLLTFPFTIYLISYQYIIAKSWCRLCLIVQGSLCLECIITLTQGLPMVMPHADSITLSLLGLSFLLPALFWMLFKRPLSLAVQNYPLRRELQKVKFNANYVQSQFRQQPIMPPIFTNMRVPTLGNQLAANTLTIVTNPTCGPCIKLHPELESLLARNQEMRVQFVFVTYGQSRELVHKLLSLPDDKLPVGLQLCYSKTSADKKLWKEITHALVEDEYALHQIDIHHRWCDLAGITGTPTIFLNGHQLPLSYTIQDVDALCEIVSDHEFLV